MRIYFYLHRHENDLFLVMPSFAEKIQTAIELLRTRSIQDSRKVNKNSVLFLKN